MSRWRIAVCTVLVLAFTGSNIGAEDSNWNARIEEVLSAWARVEAERESRRLARLEEVLSAWARAAAERQSLDASITEWKYDDTFKTVNVARGRLYFERPNRAHVSYTSLTESEGKRHARSKTKFVQRPSTQWIWTGTRIFSIEPDERAYSNLPVDLLRENWPVRVNPHGLLPLLLDDDLDAIRDRYNLDLVSYQPPILLAMSKRGFEHLQCNQIKVLLDSSSHLPFAIRMDNGFGQITVVRLNDVRINQRPTDRDTLLNPCLEGFAAR